MRGVVCRRWQRAGCGAVAAVWHRCGVLNVVLGALFRHVCLLDGELNLCSHSKHAVSVKNRKRRQVTPRNSALHLFKHFGLSLCL